jgi:hypothetical protein
MTVRIVLLVRLAEALIGRLVRSIEYPNITGVRKRSAFKLSVSLLAKSTSMLDAVPDSFSQQYAHNGPSHMFLHGLWSV